MSMPFNVLLGALAFLCATALLGSSALVAQAPKPETIIADGVPQIPEELPELTRPYLSSRAVLSASWHPADRAMLIATTFGNVPQLHRVDAPLGMRRQISFATEPIRFGSYSPGSGDVLIVQKDVAGSEFYQIYRLENGRLELLTDGKSRNVLGAWSRDGSLIGYSSTRRNGTDADLYVMNPREPSSDRMILEVTGGGWQIRDFSDEGRTALVEQSISLAQTNLFELDLATGALREITDPSVRAYYRGAHYGPENEIWVISDAGSDVQRLGTLDRERGTFKPALEEARWETERFDIAPNGSFVAFVLNEAGMSRLHILNRGSTSARAVADLPSGLINSLDIAPWGEIAVTLSSSAYPLDAFAIDPGSLRVMQWTDSETGGLDTSNNVEPELIAIESSDGLLISGFLYRPDPVRFPGQRPLIMDIHGGPEAQARPIYQFEKNYLLNELGIAIFYPNVRGSTGFGKRFVALDNGPYKREDTLFDLQSFLDHLRKDPRLDPERTGVTGASYGGYLCYASAIRFGKALRAAACEVAVSNFVTVLESMESYRRDLRRPEYGDERDPQQRAKLMEISPLTRAGEIRIPLLVVTGANDPRVPRSEADQMVDAVRANGQKVWHLIATNEGHGFVNKDNDGYRFWTTLLFWKSFLLQ